MKPLVFVDLDDTLIDTSPLYEQAYRLFCSFMGTMGVSPSAARLTLTQADHDLFGQFGLSRHRFPQSMVEAARRLLPGTLLAAHDVEQLEQFGYGVFGRPSPAFPGAHIFLGWLSRQGFDLCIYTAGDEHVQRSRMVSARFDHVPWLVTPKKDAAAMTTACASYGREPSQCWMVGNSLASDILPALAAGLRVVHIERRGGYPPPWDLHTGPPHHHECYHQAEDLAQALRILAHNARAAA